MVDHAALGWNTEALVELFYRPGTTLDEVARDAARAPEVVEAWSVTGEADAIARVRTEDNADLERLIMDLQRDGLVIRTRSQVVLSRLVEAGGRGALAPGASRIIRFAGGAIGPVGSSRPRIEPPGEYPSGQRGGAVNAMAHAFAGSNPASPSSGAALGRSGELARRLRRAARRRPPLPAPAPRSACWISRPAASSTASLITCWNIASSASEASGRSRSSASRTLGQSLLRAARPLERLPHAPRGTARRTRAPTPSALAAHRVADLERPLGRDAERGQLVAGPLQPRAEDLVAARRRAARISPSFSRPLQERRVAPPPHRSRQLRRRPRSRAPRPRTAPAAPA